jgi:hypothetical protein
MNPLWLKDPAKWESLQLSEKVKLLREYYCTGPCGQSSHILTTRSVLENFRRAVICQLLVRVPQMKNT